jgi:hypothetical protein
MADTKNVYQRLLEAQAHIVAPRQESRFKTGSRSAEQILEAAKPACRDSGLLLVTNEVVEFIGERTRIKAEATVYNVDKPEESVSASASSWEGDISNGLDASQVSGKTGSYAKKYALQNLFAIDDTKDADFDDAKSRVQTAPPVVAKPGKQFPELEAEYAVSTQPAPNLIDDLKDDLADLLRAKGFNSGRIRSTMASLTSEAEVRDMIMKLKGGTL